MPEDGASEQKAMAHSEYVEKLGKFLSEIGAVPKEDGICAYRSFAFKIRSGTYTRAAAYTEGDLNGEEFGLSKGEAHPNAGMCLVEVPLKDVSEIPEALDIQAETVEQDYDFTQVKIEADIKKTIDRRSTIGGKVVDEDTENGVIGSITIDRTVITYLDLDDDPDDDPIGIFEKIIEPAAKEYGFEIGEEVRNSFEQLKERMEEEKEEEAEYEDDLST